MTTHLRDVPAYTLTDAARHLGIPRPTLKEWAAGRTHADDDRHGRRCVPAVIEAADAGLPLLSFRNMVELYVLGALRRVYRVRFPRVREAVAWLKHETGSRHPLADLDLMTDGSGIFIRFGEYLLDASARGQATIPEAVAPYLERVIRDDVGPVRLFPLTRDRVEHSPRTIVMDPAIRFGRPFLIESGVETEAVYARFRGGDSVALLVKEFGADAEAIEEAIRFENGRRLSAA